MAWRTGLCMLMAGRCTQHVYTAKIDITRAQPGMRFLSFLFVSLLSVSYGHAQLFSDNFSRGTDPGPLSPWVAQSGNWAVTGGQLVGGTNANNSFAFLYVTN